MKRQPVKLKYLKDIERLKYECEYMMETKNISSLDTSDIDIYQDEFRNIFPHLIIDEKFNLNNENALDLNEILKYLAISLNFKFNDKEISKEDIQSFHEKLQWGNQEHKTEFQHYSLKSRLLSIIISFSNSEEQIFITLYCLYRKVPCFLGYIVYDEFKYNVTNKIYSWSKDISYIALYKGLFLPKHRKKAKLAYEKHIKDIDKFLSKDKSHFIQNYISKTNYYLCPTTANSRFFKIYREIMYVLIMNNYQTTALVINGLNKYELSVLETEFTLLTNKIHDLNAMKPARSFYHYFNLNKNKDDYLKQYISSMSSQQAFNLLCFLKGNYNEEIITAIFYKLNRTKVYINNENIFSLAHELSKKYPNNAELGKYLSKRVMLEIEGK